MLELPIEEYRVTYRLSMSSKILIDVMKIGLDWAWSVRSNGEVLGADTASSLSDASKSALRFAKRSSKEENAV